MELTHSIAEHVKVIFEVVIERLENANSIYFKGIREMVGHDGDFAMELGFSGDDEFYLALRPEVVGGKVEILFYLLPFKNLRPCEKNSVDNDGRIEYSINVMKERIIVSVSSEVAWQVDIVPIDNPVLLLRHRDGLLISLFDGDKIAKEAKIWSVDVGKSYLNPVLNGLAVFDSNGIRILEDLI